MALNCGANTSLDSLNEVRDNIKSALAEGKAALGDLQSKVSEATAQFEGLKAEIEQNVSSLQEDLQALSTKFGEEFAAAQNDLKEKWGDVMDAAQLDEYVASIPSLDDILSGSASLPDLCTTVENIAVKINEDGTKEKIVKAAAALKPNTKMTEVPKFEPVVIDNSTQVSTANPISGQAFIGLNGVAAKQFEVRNKWLREEYQPSIDALNELSKARQQDPLFKSIKAKIKSTGLKGKELQAQGLLTDQEIQFRANFYRDIFDPRDSIKFRWKVVAALVSLYEDVVAGVIPRSDWEQADAEIRADNRFATSDYALLDRIYALSDTNADLLIGWAKYLNRV